MTEPAPIADVATSRQFVTFGVDDNLYGADIRIVREIRQWSPTTTLPNQRYYTRGVLDIRGDVVPVHDLRARLGGQPTAPSESNVIAILSVRAQSIGVLVDRVCDIVEAKAGDVKPAPAGARDGDEDAILGLLCHDGRIIALLDPEELFAA